MNPFVPYAEMMRRYKLARDVDDDPLSDELWAQMKPRTTALLHCQMAGTLANVGCADYNYFFMLGFFMSEMPFEEARDLARYAQVTTIEDMIPTPKPTKPRPPKGRTLREDEGKA
jgi:hypothetical protein